MAFILGDEKKAKPNPRTTSAAMMELRGHSSVQEGQRKKPRGSETHSCGSNDAGFDPIGNATGHRREERHYGRLGDQDKPCALGTETFHVLQVHAQRNVTPNVAP